MELTRNRIILLVVAALIVGAALITPYILFRDELQEWIETDVADWIEQLGPWGPIAYIAFFAGSMLFAPVPTAPAPIIAATVFGGALGFLYTLIGTAIGSAICFWLARKLGRPMLRRLMSQGAVDKVDELGERLGLRLLIVLRLFPIAGVDYVSYAAGLTQMRFGIYIVVSVLASAPILGIAAVLGEGVVGDWRLLAGAAGGLLLFFAVPLGWVWWRRRRERRDSLRES